MKNLFVLFLMFSSPVDAIVQDISEDNELSCMAHNIFYEAENQSMHGKRGVASTVWNRIKYKGRRNFGKTICQVVTKSRRYANGVPIRNKCHFSWYCDGKSDRPVFFNAKGEFDVKKHAAWLDSVKVATEYLDGTAPDVTNGALYYFAWKKVLPYWAVTADFTETAMIQDHRFGTLDSDK